MDYSHHMEGHDTMDHSTMDHSSMDHSNHDRGSHGGESMSNMHMSHMDGMNMWFQFSTNATVLFQSWHFTTVGGLIGSMIGIFIMAALYEGLKYYREYLFWKTYNALQYRSVSLPDKGAVSDEPQIVQPGILPISKRPSMLSKIHFFQTFLHIVQMILSYFLMLIFMTYNVWLCIAIVLGAGIGYFLFGWKKSVIVDVTEHCH
ncbi:high affinity copper uptake protein 1-like isoform X2 [Sitophilus oryzae]|uniref:Copper transport protein n=1 Tax=Sitophilus oryzae TaxID=7048 RepID=A0A6J2XC05_SITOR|nr:high affinity copper uptake protein 1-like isoform X2 [Sitophilus oryzae]